MGSHSFLCLPCLAHSKYSINIYWMNGWSNNLNILASYFQSFVCTIEPHCLRTYCDNRLLSVSEKTWMFCSSNIARRCCNCCRWWPLGDFLACRNLGAKIKETIAFCDYSCSNVAERHVYLSSLSLCKGTSLSLVGIDCTLHSKTHISGYAKCPAHLTILTCKRVMLPSLWSQARSLVLGILWVYVSLCALSPRGLGSDTLISFLTLLSRILLFLDILEILS